MANLLEKIRKYFADNRARRAKIAAERRIKNLVRQSRPQKLSANNDQEDDLSREDSEGDGLFFGDPMFPPENFDEDE